MAVFTATLFTSFLFILLPQFAWGRVLLDDITNPTKQIFTLQEFCQEMVTHPTPLIDIKSISSVDCMGKKISVGDFCLKKMATDPYYLRGYARNNKIECLSGKKVLFKYACLKNDKLCKRDALQSCTELKAKLAYRLELVHSAIIEKDKFKQLNCFYETLPSKIEQ